MESERNICQQTLSASIREQVFENCDLRGTDSVQGKISEHIFKVKLMLLCLLFPKYFSVTWRGSDQSRARKRFIAYNGHDSVNLSGSKKCIILNHISHMETVCLLLFKMLLSWPISEKTSEGIPNGNPNPNSAFWNGFGVFEILGAYTDQKLSKCQVFKSNIIT